jgi:hypothetical protein
MRSWGSRADTVVCDEPFYAHYLAQTNYTHHPSFPEIVAHHETRWQRVVEQLTGPLPRGKSVFYQKQMAHHLLPHIPLEWTDELTNVFLIRDPREMLLSLLEFFPDPTLPETGLPQQVQLLERVVRRGADAVVIDARDVLCDPRGMLTRLCDRIGIAYDEAMLRWEPGLRETDGIWARDWYDKVARTTTFVPYRAKPGAVPLGHRPLLAECQALYDALAAYKFEPPAA